MSLIAALESQGYSREKLKKRFEDDGLRTSQSPKDLKLVMLMERHSSRVRDALAENARDARTFAAIDRAYDISQEQISQTIMQGLIDKDYATEEVQSAIKTWKLHALVVDVFDDKGVPVLARDGSRQKALNLPVFFNIFVPITVAYTKARWAKLWKDRDTVPLYKVDPAANSLESHLVGKIITAELAKESDQMGHRETERDVILPTLLYSYAWTFTASDYEIDYSYSKDGSAEPVKYVVREGIKFIIPHSSKVIFDRSAPMTSINTDTGVRWCGYWSVVPFSTIDNDKFWNTEKIAMSGNSNSQWMRPENWKLYTEFYPCTLKFPDSITNAADFNIREDCWYTRTEHQEAAVQLVTLFDKIVPKECGLYDCDVAVWHRFVYAGDGTVIDCVPISYTPAAVDTYDFDPNRRRNTSLTQEIVPFQDMIQNLLTQSMLSVKQNLSTVVFYDSSMIDAKWLDVIRNLGEKRFRSTVYIPYNKKRYEDARTAPEKIFQNSDQPKHNVSELFTAISTVLTILERVLGYSPQEVGAAASHEQSATETAITDANTNNRIALTSSFMDAGRNARARMVYESWFEYGTKAIDIELTGLTPPQLDALEKLGFKVDPIASTKSIKLTGKRSLAHLYSIARDRSANERANDAKTAQAMMQVLGAAAGNPALLQAMGPDTFVKRMGEVWDYADIPSDWRLDLDHAQPQPPAADQLKQAFEQNNAQMQGDIKTHVIAPIAQAMQKIGQGQQQLTTEVGHHEEILRDLLMKVNGIMQIAAHANVPLPPMAHPGIPQVQPDIRPLPPGINPQIPISIPGGLPDPMPVALPMPGTERP